MAAAVPVSVTSSGEPEDADGVFSGFRECLLPGDDGQS